MIGAIYAVPTNLMEGLFNAKSRVFVKVTGHASSKIAPKHKIVFYESHNEKKLVGEGIVENVEFLNPAEVLSKYGKELFINKDEFIKYVGKRQRILVIQLKGLRKYQEPVQCKEVITMGGKYLTEEEYASLIHSQTN